MKYDASLLIIIRCFKNCYKRVNEKVGFPIGIASDEKRIITKQKSRNC